MPFISKFMDSGPLEKRQKQIGGCVIWCVMRGTLNAIIGLKIENPRGHFVDTCEKNWGER